nr:GNAT family N-acetyltransferase [Kibdelosporangium sp. MJ126-NF4]CEL22851.1 FIG01201438: hypothetical protein [Kibdelosporangium sp. MJ126-NF4]CTQ89991.1 FIG01201438: hypothetical protein [Kibdelosporangium sp. MJ126-NF4]
MSDIVMRAARPDEAATLGELALRSKAHWGYDQAFLAACRAEFAYTPQDLARRRFVVAEQGQRLLGMYSIDGRAPEGELGNLWLEPDVIGQGLGRRLWQHALDTARAEGFTVLRIDADPNAEGFYQAMGAVKVGEVPSGSIPGRVLPQLRIDLPTPLLEAYDRHVRFSEAAGLPNGLRAEKDGPITRIVGEHRGFVSAPRDVSGVDDLDVLIVRQRDFYAARGDRVEWKTRANDLPADLPDRLVAAGFRPEDKETVMVGVAAEHAGEPVLPDGVRIRQIESEADIRRIDDLHTRVWGVGIADMLIARGNLTILVAEADGEVVSAGWMNLVPGKEFVGLFGGSTLPDWRGRGIYRALVAARARLAVESGVRYLWVDTTDDSRRVLERLGFTPVTTTTPYVWSPDD